MIGRLLTLGWLVVVWLAVVESFTVAAVGAGLVVAGSLMVLFRPQATTGERAVLHPLHLAGFIGYFAAKLVQANLQVAWAVIAPSRATLRRGIVAVPIVSTSDTILTLLANAISLTPGTFIVEAQRQPAVFYVHVLQLTSVEAVQLDVLDMERRLVRAFGSAATLQQIDRQIDALQPAARPPEAR